MAYYPFAPEYGATYVLTGPDGSRAVFNDQLDRDYVGMASEVTGLDSADVRESASELVQADGGLHGDFYFGRRPIVINAQIAGHGSVLERAARIDKARRASNAMRGDATLVWRPSKRQENWIPNPVAANNISGYYSASFGSPTRITTGVPGGFSTGIAWATTSTATAASLSVGKIGATSISTGRFNVSPGRSYSLRFVGNLTSVTSGTVANLRGFVYWYDASGTQIGNSVLGQVLSPVVGTDYLLEGAAVAPDTAVYARPALFLTTTNPTTFEVRASGFVFAPTTWFPPSGQPNGDTAGWWWQGDAHASESGNFLEMMTWVRRQQPFRESGGWIKTIQIPLVSQYAPLFSSALSTGGTGVALENSGSAPFYPIVSIKGASSNPTISDGTRTFRTQKLDGGVGSDPALSSSETLIVDMLNHTAVISGGTRNGQSGNRYIDFTNTSWPYLAPATTTTFTLTGGGSATVQYRDAWV